jgi:hypothetical protein
MDQLPPRQSFEYRRDGVTIEQAFLCPVCDYPTVYQPGCYGICDLCNWEDDDCDEGGANGDYTLTEARSNFKGHLSMYRLTHEISLHIVELEQERGITAQKKRKMEILKKFMEEASLDRRGELYQAYRDTQ